jgi:hypothetical protein
MTDSVKSDRPFGGEMTCKKCASAHQQEFQGELTVAFTGKERISLSPVYVSQKTLVCLNCGYIELVLPAPQLEQLRKGAEALDSEGETAV